MDGLIIEDVVRSFYGVATLKGVSFKVPSRGITGLIGPNGAGKTTLFNCISGAIPPDGGKVIFNGTDITGLRPDQVSRTGLVRTFQISRGLPRMSVLENLILYGRDQPGEGLVHALLRTSASSRRNEELIGRATEIARRLNLTRHLDAPAAALSGGQKKLLEIGRVLMAEPKMVLLDEPVAGVNPSLARDIGHHLSDLAAEGLPILLIEHHMDLIAKLCDRVIVMADGQFLTQGTFDDLTRDPRVLDVYMGRRWRRAG